MCAQLFWFKRNILEDLKTHGYREQNLGIAQCCHLRKDGGFVLRWMSRSPVLSWTKRLQRFKDLYRSRWTSRDADIDGNVPVDWTGHGIAPFVYMPQLMAQSPNAMTIFGSGVALYVSFNGSLHVDGHGPRSQ